MDEYSRFQQRNAQRFAEQEALEEEQRALEADRQRLTTRRSSEELVYKTYAPAPQPQQNTTMTSEQQAPWDEWGRSLIRDELADYVKGADAFADSVEQALDEDNVAVVMAKYLNERDRLLASSEMHTGALEVLPEPRARMMRQNG
jgi:hypothetical protein